MVKRIIIDNKEIEITDDTYVLVRKFEDLKNSIDKAARMRRVSG